MLIVRQLSERVALETCWIIDMAAIWFETDGRVWCCGREEGYV
jgi:hypothetical protein